MGVPCKSGKSTQMQSVARSAAWQTTQAWRAGPRAQHQHEQAACQPDAQLTSQYSVANDSSVKLQPYSGAAKATLPLVGSTCGVEGRERVDLT